MAGFRPMRPLLAKVMTSMAAPVLDCRSAAAPTPARKAERRGGHGGIHRVSEPLRILERSGARAHLLEADKDQSHAKQSTRQGLPEWHPDGAQHDTRPAHHQRDQGMNIQRGDECQYGEANIAPDHNRRRLARLDQAGIRHAHEDERDRRGALHERARHESKGASE